MRLRTRSDRESLDANVFASAGGYHSRSTGTASTDPSQTRLEPVTSGRADRGWSMPSGSRRPGKLPATPTRLPAGRSPVDAANSIPRRRFPERERRSPLISAGEYRLTCSTWSQLTGPTLVTPRSSTPPERRARGTPLDIVHVLTADAKLVEGALVLPGEAEAVDHGERTLERARKVRSKPLRTAATRSTWRPNC